VYLAAFKQKPLRNEFFEHTARFLRGTFIKKQHYLLNFFFKSSVNILLMMINDLIVPDSVMLMLLFKVYNGSTQYPNDAPFYLNGASEAKRSICSSFKTYKIQV